MQVFHSNYPNLLALTEEFVTQNPTSLFFVLKTDTGITSFDLATLLPECTIQDVSTFLNHLENMQNNITTNYKDYNENVLLLLDRTSIKPFTFFSYSNEAIRAAIKSYEVGLNGYLILPNLTPELKSAIETGFDVEKFFFIGRDCCPHFIFNVSGEVFFQRDFSDQLTCGLGFDPRATTVKSSSLKSAIFFASSFKTNLKTEARFVNNECDNANYTAVADKLTRKYNIEMHNGQIIQKQTEWDGRMEGFTFPAYLGEVSIKDTHYPLIEKALDKEFTLEDVRDILEECAKVKEKYVGFEHLPDYVTRKEYPKDVFYDKVSKLLEVYYQAMSNKQTSKMTFFDKECDVLECYL